MLVKAVGITRLIRLGEALLLPLRAAQKTACPTENIVARDTLFFERGDGFVVWVGHGAGAGTESILLCDLNFREGASGESRVFSFRRRPLPKGEGQLEPFPPGGGNPPGEDESRSPIQSINRRLAGGLEMTTLASGIRGSHMVATPVQAGDAHFSRT